MGLEVILISCIPQPIQGSLSSSNLKCQQVSLIGASTWLAAALMYVAIVRSSAAAPINICSDRTIFRSCSNKEVGTVNLGYTVHPSLVWDDVNL
jgi:hypothetical protein